MSKPLYTAVVRANLAHTIHYATEIGEIASALETAAEDIGHIIDDCVNAPQAVLDKLASYVDTCNTNATSVRDLEPEDPEDLDYPYNRSLEYAKELTQEALEEFSL